MRANKSDSDTSTKGRQANLPVDAGRALVVSGLFKWFGGVKAINDLSFDIAMNEIVGLIGPNGSGKTTALNLIAGRFRPDAGEIVFHGTSIVGWPASRIARRGIIRTWQDPRIIPDYSARENVELGVLARRRVGSARNNSPNSSKIANYTIEELIERFGLTEVAAEPAGNLPYGIQKIVAFARSIAAGPELLLLDEPFAGLSKPEAQNLVDHIKEFRLTGSVVIVDHSFGIISDFCDRIIVLDAGTKLVEGLPDQVRQDENVIRVYFGKDASMDSVK